ncbi:LacI family DNA-binding transcriptional regulator [Conexibacter stalactiti]|uniref:LacI family DNA-binding transcriptional regulator n=1 Tax=Conexibacter stalactiti TaxID=1940611 RepID=A0ABU4HMR2_9ACTN|nr:LacI family DNA-binding transcriptional regulator [Conexibacter stalactiti]MDW5594596.1 LacI family DNA-binding transcriptional regulator [Conexibacter stalactiti]MEC5035238.1 LacI family DNA-binding transcriptional regulator [Conexibacter stalactiti]
MGTNRTRVGIKEVAAAAGVSVTTVSHALNNKGRLPEATRQRVRAIADQLGYKPNATARNLVVGRTGLIGLVVSQHGGPPFAVTDFAYFGQLMLAASTAAIGEGYALVLAPADGALAPQGGIAVDGAIIVDPVRDDPLVSALGRAGITVVTTGRMLGDDRSCWVDNDHIAGTRSMLDHLQRCGAERIALMTSPLEISYTFDVERAYREWCASERVEPIVKAPELGLSERAGYAAAGELLSLPEPPDAIFATYDRLAYGTLMAAEARGVRVPDDLLLATTATESQAPEQARPALTTLNLNPEEIGRAAASLLIALLDDEEPARHVVVPHRVVVRSSTRRKR